MLGIIVISQEIRINIAKKTYIFVFFKGGVRTLCLPPLDPRMDFRWVELCFTLFILYTEPNKKQEAQLQFFFNSNCTEHSQIFMISNDNNAKPRTYH